VGKYKRMKKKRGDEKNGRGIIKDQKEGSVNVKERK